MKKYLSSILSLILALAMVFSLVACGADDSSDDDDDDDSKASSSESSSDDSDDSSSDDEEDEDDDEDDETSSESKTSKPSKDEDDDEDEDEDVEDETEEVTRTYDTSYGVEITIPASWSLVSDKEKQEMFGSLAYMYDIVVKAPNNENIIVGSGSADGLTEEEFIAAFTGSLATQGYTFGDEESIRLGKNTYIKAVGTIEKNGITVTQGCYARIFDDTAVFIVITTTSSDIEDLETMIS